LALRAIAVASEGGDAVHAVEAAARTLRVTAAITAESRTAVAHTKASINVLTWVPLVLTAWLITRDERARTFFASAAGIACLLIGISLHWVGRRWVQRLAMDASRVDSDVPDFVDVVSVYLRSGQPPALAFLHASDTAPGMVGVAARSVAELVHDGGRFVDALTSSRHAFGLHAQPVIDALIDTERDGLAPRELFDRLATDAHAQRRRDADMRIRALPVRLTLPLVGCILPAYVLLAVVPLLASQLSSVNLDLP
jgi:Flp pilus assembly protein TadB